jgi:hypothetical protein
MGYDMYRPTNPSSVVKRVERSKNVAQAGTKTMKPAMHVFQNALIITIYPFGKTCSV